MRKNIFLSLTLVLLLSGTMPALMAQSSAGTISGTVTDTTGGVLPGVEVRITKVDTGQTRLAITGDEGRYSAPQLAVGIYEVRAELAGFQTSVQPGVQLQIGQEALVNLTLEIGSISEEVIVSGEAPLVNTTSGTISAVISEVQVHELPLNSRNLTQLALLTPGVVQLRAGITGGVTTGAPAVRVSIGGARFYQTGFFLDGTDVTDSSRGMGPAGAAGSMFGVETVKEFRVITNNYSAEYSRFSGGVMSMVTKTGTNQIHGSLFMFHRNDNFDAADFFANKFDLGKPEFRRHQFGVTVGGPIVKDKTFFFFSFEGFREGLGISDVDTVPTLEAKQGIMPATGGACSAFLTGLGGVYNGGTDKCVIPVNPLAQPFLALYGPPNRPSEDGGLTADQAANTTQPTNEDYFNARVDHNFSDSDSFFARYTTSVGSKDQGLDGGSHQPSALTTTRNDNHYSTVEWKHIFSPNSIYTFRFGAQRNTWYQDPSNDGGIYIGFYPDRAMGVIGVGDGVARQGINVNGQNVSNQFSYANDMFLTRGRHDIKLGFLATRHQTNDFTLGRGGGEFTFDSVPDFVAGNPYRWRGRNADDEPQRGVRQTVLGFFIQDDFKLRPTFTVNLGLRYEPTVALSEVNGRLLNLRGDLTTVTEAVFGEPYFENPSKTNFAPRIGFAWDPFGDGKTSVRGGYGIFHITILPFHYSNQIRRSPPLSVSPDIRESKCGGCVSAAFPRPPAEAENPPAGAVAFQTAEYKPSQPYAQQWNFSLQREIMGGVTLTGAYVGSRGVNLQAQRNVNVRIPEILSDGRALYRKTARRNTNFGDIDHWEFSSSSFYHGFNGGIKKRFAEGLQFQVAYTFGRSIDTASRVNFSDIQENLGKFPQDQLNLPTSNRGLSAHDVRNNLSFNYVWEIPYRGSGAARHLLGGWQMNGILQLSTGSPETLRLGGSGGTRDWNRDSESSSLAERPTLRPGGTLNAVREGGRDPDRYFDLNQFILHEPGTHGNVGRNTLIGPGVNTFDFSLFKNFDVGEDVEVQFRAEFFNIFNRTNFGAVDNRIVQRARVTSADCGDVHGSTGPSTGCSQLVRTESDPLGFDYRTTGGRITRSRTTSRQIQFGLRLVF